MIPLMIHCAGETLLFQRTLPFCRPSRIESQALASYAVYNRFTEVNKNTVCSALGRGGARPCDVRIISPTANKESGVQLYSRKEQISK